MGIARQNIEDAIAKRDKPVTLYAGARTRSGGVEGQERIAYPQASDGLEEDVMCVIKAAASGIHYCGYEDPAAAIMESAINTRRKTKDVVTLLRAQGVTTEDVTTRSNDAPSLLEKVTKLVEKKDPSRVLTELVDANGQSGHAVFIDCANQPTRARVCSHAWGGVPRRFVARKVPGIATKHVYWSHRPFYPNELVVPL